MTMDSSLQKFKESFKDLDEILESFKNSQESDIQKDLKFYRTVYGKTAAPSYNQTLLSVHQVQEQLNTVFLPKRYPSGNIKIFNDHQLEMIDCLLDPNSSTVPYEKTVEEVSKVLDKKPKNNSFLELQRNSSKCLNPLRPKTSHIFSRKIHPYAELINGNLDLPIEEMYADSLDAEKFASRSLESVPLKFIDTEADLKEMYAKLKNEKIIAVDLEHHNFHSYNGLVSLIQISDSSEDFLVDPIRLREALQLPEFSLNFILADPKILKIFHGAESDIEWLQRDFDTFIVNMFDSYHAAKILNLPRMSLAYLLEHFCGVELDKTYQLADWRERPLPQEMIEYARKDTHYLVYLYFLMKEKLSMSQFEQVLERSNQQCLSLFSPILITEKSWKSVLDRSNYPLVKEQVETVRRVFYWREWKAKKLDVCPAALMPNSYILRIAHSRAVSVEDLRSCLKNVSSLLSKEFEELSQFLQSYESKESEFYLPSSEFSSTVDVKASSHVRFEEESGEVESEAKKLKIIEEPKKIERGRVSFVSKTASSGSSLFGSSSNLNNGKILLAGLVKESAAKVDTSAFKTREAEALEKEAAEKEAKALEEAKIVAEEVKAVVHGSNRTIDNLELSVGGSDSKVLADKLRQQIKSSIKQEGQGIKPLDFNEIITEASEAADAAPIFDPYQTLKEEKNRVFIEAKIAGETAPRLSTSRASGNRMASFTEKRK